MVFDDGTRRVELTRLGPAHSKGDAVAYLPREKILVTGDLCVNWNWGNNVGDPDANFDNWIRVLDDLAPWNIQTLVPGHGSLGTTARSAVTLRTCKKKCGRGCGRARPSTS